MIKGSTKIELKNIKTNEVQVIESDNIVTNAMNRLLLGANPFLPNTELTYNFGTKKTPISFLMCGGLLLFKDSIVENANTVYPNSNNTMIGNAVAGFSNAEEVSEMGFFDAENSSWEISEDGSIIQKLCYEFGTGHANGQISCVCLSSFFGGYVGFGNLSGKRTTASATNLNLNSTVRDHTFFNDTHTQLPRKLFDQKKNQIKDAEIVFVDYRNNRIAWVDKKNLYATSSEKDKNFRINKTLSFYLSYLPLSSINPLQFIEDYEAIYYKKIDIKIPDNDLVQEDYYNSAIQKNMIIANEDCFYIVMGETTHNDYSNLKNIKPGEKLVILKFSLDFELLKTYEIVNTLEETKLFEKGEIRDFSFNICEGKIYWASDYYIHIINLEDQTDVSKIDTENEQEISGYSCFNKRAHYKINNGVWYAINEKEKKFCPLNGTGAEHLGYGEIVNSNQEFFLSREGASNKIRTNPFYLATINNLEETVEKTADMVMKVTYTLKYEPEGS